MMWSEKDVEAASNAAISDMLEQEANGTEYVDIRAAMRAALNAVSGWQQVNKNTPIETAVLVTARFDDGTYSEVTIAYYDPHLENGWTHARTDLLLGFTPTLWMPLPAPPTDPNASEG